VPAGCELLGGCGRVAGLEEDVEAPVVNRLSLARPEGHYELVHGYFCVVFVTSAVIPSE
jgi:hypothetical protein